MKNHQTSFSTAPPNPDFRRSNRAETAILHHIGRMIRAFRLQQRWTISQLAESSGISERFISDIENGIANPSIKRLIYLTTALNAPLASLLSASPQNRIIALVGLRGAGKSTTGSRLASRLGLPFYELDGLVEDRCGLSLEQIFALHGEAYYRRLEKETLVQFLNTVSGAVLETSGGIVTDGETFRLVQEHCHMVWLQATPEDHLERVRRQGDERPMQNRPEAMAELKELLRRREPLYSRAAVQVNTSEMSIQATVEHLTALLTPVGTVQKVG